MTPFQKSYDSISRLVEVFEDVMRGRKALEFDEASTRASLIDPFWEALGWNVRDPREVVLEKRVPTRKGTKRADYCFNVRARPAFVVEAKHAGMKLTDPDLVFQAKRYGYNLPVPVAVLTDFEEFRPFKSALEPTYENPGRGLIKEFDLTYDQYLDRWEDIYKIFSREAVYDGSLDKLAGTGPRHKEALDKKFFERLTTWREELARVIALDNGDVSVYDLNEAVQRILDRIIFVRVIEDREIEPFEHLQDAVNRWAREKEKPLYQYIVDVFRRMDPQYNGQLFAGHFSEELLVRDKPLEDFIESLYYPRCPYQFNVIGVELLGTIYERFLGSTIRLTAGHRAKVEEKPEVRKAGGVYYTPAYIVDYIVENTVGELLAKCKTPKDVARLKILDPACGSGSFLLGAFRRLIEWHEDYYNAHPEKISKGAKAECWHDKDHPDGPRYRLTARTKGRILVNNIYGVDIDPQAVEVTIMSLYLKVLEDVDRAMLMKTALLPPLDGNIKCGNSLIGSDYWDFVRAEQGELFEWTEAEDRRVNPFDWDQEFPDIIKYKPGTRDLAAGYGFDAVIGNPPYVNIVALPEDERRFLKGTYKTYKNKSDLYSFFVEKALSLKNNYGRVGVIIPHTWLATDSFALLRKRLFDKLAIESITELGSRVFQKVAVSTVVLVCTNANETIKVFNPDLSERFEIPSKLWNKEPYHIDLCWTKDKQRIFDKLCADTVPLNTIIEFSRGIKTSDDNRFIFKKRLKKECRKVYRGRNIKAYELNWGGEYIWYKPDLMRQKVGSLPHSEEFFEVPEKLVTQRVNSSMQLLVAYDDSQNYFLDTTNVSRFDSWDNEHSLKFVLGLMNSRLVNYWYTEKYRMPTIGIYELHSIPIKAVAFSDPADVAKHDRMVELVDEMLGLHKRLAAAKSDADRTRLERAVKATDRKIDALVYELYGLTEEEIAVVEG